MILFFDWEVFKHDNLVVIIDPEKKEEYIFINDRDGFKEFYDQHKEYIWCGFNVRNYDQWITKAVIAGFNTKDVNDWIIKDGRKGWEYSSLFNQIPLNIFDCMTGFFSLKQLEGFIGKKIHESSIPFDIDRKLTASEIAETVEYCRDDVKATMEVFIERKNEFDSHLALITNFKLPLKYIGKTQAQLAAIILGAKKQRFNDEWDIRLPESLQLKKYKHVAEWFLCNENHDYSKKLVTDIGGVETTLSWGGIHSGLAKYHYHCKPDEMLIMADVDQLYPTIMVQYSLLSRAVKDDIKFKKILETSLKLKKEGRKKEREPYKRICNIVYGAEGDSYNPMFDPLHRTLVCVFGQTLMVDLIEKLEPIIKLVQANTDGILVIIKRKDYDVFCDLIQNWEKRTSLKMSFDEYQAVIQKDVNNYIVVSRDGSLKRKGAYVKKLNKLDYDMPIVNKAMIDFIVNGVPVEETILNCNELKEFQIVKKISNKYSHIVHGDQILKEKCIRCFASKFDSDAGLIKMHKETGRPAKIENTPIKAFIYNNNVNGVKCPRKLDKTFYIELAKKRLGDFGCQNY